MPAKISLLHATYRRTDGALEIKQAWLATADHPELIEYIFGMDSDDDVSLLETVGHPRIVCPPGGEWVTSVRNWNAAASLASGDLLMAVSDDLFPPQGWDTRLRKVCHGLDASTIAFAIKVGDSPKVNDVLMRHPVVSRRFYQTLGFFSDSYHGVFCDQDITVRAFRLAVILDGRTLRLEHRHPKLDASIELSESTRRVHAASEYEYARRVFKESWTPIQRGTRVRLVRGGQRAFSSPLGPTLLRFTRRFLLIVGTLEYYTRRAVGATRRLRSRLPGSQVDR